MANGSRQHNLSMNFKKKKKKIQENLFLNHFFFVKFLIEKLYMDENKTIMVVLRAMTVQWMSQIGNRLRPPMKKDS